MQLYLFYFDPSISKVVLLQNISEEIPGTQLAG